MFEGRTMQINVRTPNENTISIRLTELATISELKRILEDRTGVPQHDIGLVCI